MKLIIKLVAAVIAIAVIGVAAAVFTIPNKRTIEQETEINASQEVVWQVLMDREKYPDWQDAISKVEMTGDDTWNEITADGQKIEFKRTLADKPTEMRIEYKMGDQFSGTWKGELKSAGSGKTLFKTTDTNEAHSSLTKIMMAIFFDFEDFVKTWNAKLKKRAESLETKDTKETVESPLHPN